MSTKEEAMAVLSVGEKQALLRARRSGAEVIYRKALKAGVEFKSGAGKGLEPKENWCPCHNRDPCPIDEELKY